MMSLASSLAGVDGWLETEDALWLARFVADAAKAELAPTIVEIGSWKGRSAIAMGLALRSSGRGRLFAIDPHLGEPSDPSDTMPEFLANLDRAGVSEYVEPIRAFSREPLDRFAAGSVAFLFLDGSHEYEEVVRDIKAWTPKLAENAVLAFDDADWPGVNQAISEHVTRFGNVFRRPRYLGKILYCRVTRKQRWTVNDTITALRLRIFLRSLLIGTKLAPRTHWRILQLARAALRGVVNLPMGKLPSPLVVFLLCGELLNCGDMFSVVDTISYQFA